MSIAEKLASLDYYRLVRIELALRARDWPEGGMYDAERNVTMDKWAELVKRELQSRKKAKVTA